MAMKLLLKKDVARLGIVGDVVEVSPGFARNYLLPMNLATEPTAANMKKLAAARAEAEERRRKQRMALEAVAAKLGDVEITIEAAANEDGVLYGSVGPREVAAALRDLGHDLSPAEVHLRDPIKHLDTVLVDVVLADDLKTKVKVWVVRSKAEMTDEETEDGDDSPRGKEADDFDANADE
jgi:large subunit ribosomal protein L9